MSDINPIEQSLVNQDFEKEKIRNTVPSFILDENPKFYEFLKAYYDWLMSQDNIGDDILNLKSARNIDVSNYLSSIKFELGQKIPIIGSLNNSTLLKIVQLFYDAKGSKESIEAYFRLFLNEEITIEYPKDNMLITDDGTWDNSESRFTTNKGFLDDAYIVLQDDFFYQIYSYVIKSGLSVDEWGTLFNEIAHPAGWIFFGEIEIVGFAQFRIGTLSPLIVPGTQEDEDFPLELLSEAAHDEQAKFQSILLIMYPMANFNTYTTGDFAYNLLRSQRISIADLQNFTIAELTTNPVLTNLRPGSQIDIS